MLALLPIPVVIESCMPTVWQISVDWKYARKAIQTMQWKLNNVRNTKACVFTTRRGHTIWLWVQGEAGVIKCTWPYPSSSLLIWSQKLIIYSQSSCRFEGLVALSEKKKKKISHEHTTLTASLVPLVHLNPRTATEDYRFVYYQESNQPSSIELPPFPDHLTNNSGSCSKYSA